MSNQSKPAREWASHFPEPIRSQFLANCDDPKCSIRPNHYVDTPVGAITNAIHWNKTPEGGYYWLDIYKRAEAGEFDQPLEPTEPATEGDPLFTPEQWEWVKSLSTNEEARKRMRAFCHAMLKATEQ